MQNVYLRKDWGSHKAGQTVGVEDKVAENLRGQGIAHNPYALPKASAAKPKAAKKKAKKKAAKK